MRRRFALALVPALLVAGCATPLPEPQPEAEPAVAPAALASTQVDRVLEDMHAVIDEANAAGLAAADADEPAEARKEAAAILATRADGAAGRILNAEYVLASEAGEEVITVIPDGAQTVVTPATTEWPRVLMVVTEAAEDLQAPMLLTLVQDGPREEYRLWSWERLFGGVELPATYLPAVGSDPVPPDGGTALLTPQETIDHYIGLITDGEDSEYFDEFTDSPLWQRISEQRDAWEEAVGEGTFAETYTSLKGGPYALATADGGALVVGGFSTVTTLKLSDSTLTVADPATTALLGTDTIEDNLTLTWVATLAFSVPPAGSQDPITVLGAEYALVGASGE